MNPDVQKLNEERALAVDTGRNPYSGNLANLSTYSSAINSSNLGSQPYKLNNTPLDTTASGITGASQATIDQQKVNDKLAQDQADKEAKVVSSENTIQGLLGQQTQAQNARSLAEGDVNTPGTPAYMKETARNASNALLKSQRAQQAEEKTVLESSLPEPEKQTNLGTIRRKYAFEQADLQLTAHLANSDYLAAEDTLNKKLELDLAPIKSQLEFQTQFYNNNRADLSKADDRQLTQLINQTNEAYKTQEANKKAVNDALLQASQNGVNIPPALFAKASNARDVGELTQILGASGISLANPLDMEYKRAQIANIYSEIGKRNAETSSTANTVVQLPNGSKITNETYDSRNSTINLINTVLNDPQLHNVVGGGKALQSINPLAYLPGAPHKAVKAQVDQIQGLLALENRTKLKGSGQISDYESKTLERAASAFNTNLSYAAATDALKQVRGVLTTMNGGQAYVEVTDPNTGEKATAQADTAAINKMISDGLVVKYQ